MEGGIFLVGRQNFETLHQWQTGIDHYRELAEENGDVLDGNLTGTERGKGELLAFFLDDNVGNALFAQVCLQHLLVGGFPLPGYLGSGSVDS